MRPANTEDWLWLRGTNWSNIKSDTKKLKSHNLSVWGCKITSSAMKANLFWGLLIYKPFQTVAILWFQLTIMEQARVLDCAEYSGNVKIIFCLTLLQVVLFDVPLFFGEAHGAGLTLTAWSWGCRGGCWPWSDWEPTRWPGWGWAWPARREQGHPAKETWQTSGPSLFYVCNSKGKNDRSFYVPLWWFNSNTTLLCI